MGERFETILILKENLLPKNKSTHMTTNLLDEICDRDSKTPVTPPSSPRPIDFLCPRPDKSTDYRTARPPSPFNFFFSEVRKRSVPLTSHHTTHPRNAPSFHRGREDPHTDPTTRGRNETTHTHTHTHILAHTHIYIPHVVRVYDESRIRPEFLLGPSTDGPTSPPC